MSLCNLIKIKNNTVNKPEVCLGHNNMSYALMYSSQNKSTFSLLPQYLQNTNDIIANSGIESINFSRKKKVSFHYLFKGGMQPSGTLHYLNEPTYPGIMEKHLSYKLIS